MSTESEHNDATDKTLEVGYKIKILRINQKRTLQGVSDNCGLSKSMISKIENNKTVPSVAALVKIAQLGTKISNLFKHIVEGAQKMLVGDTEYRLNARNNVYFSPVYKHGVIPVLDKVLYIDIFVYPIVNSSWTMGYRLTTMNYRLFTMDYGLQTINSL